MLNLADIRSAARKARQIAAEFKYHHGYEMPCDLLAQRIANLAQVCTQTAGSRLLAINMILMAVDEEKGPLLYKTDPAGFFAGYFATASGTKSQDAMNLLEKRLKNDRILSLDQCYELAINTLANILGFNFKGGDIEVAVVTEETPEFHILNDKEIEEQLNRIADLE